MTHPGLPPADLTAADAAAWCAARVPVPAVRAGVATAVGVLTAVRAGQDLTGESVWTVADMTGALWLLDAVAIGAGLAALGLVLWRPHAGTWAAAAAAALSAVDPGMGTTRPAWAVLAVVCAALALVDGAGAVRQRTLARAWGVASRATDGPAPGGWARQRAAALVAALGVVAAAVGTAAWLHDAAAVDAFRAVADATPGTVLGADDTHVRVSVDGRTYEVPYVLAAHRPGEVVVVHVAAGTDRAELAEDAFDPSGALFWLGAGGAVALTAGGSGVAHARRTRRRLRDGDAVIRAAVRVEDGDRFVLHPVDAVGGTPWAVVRVAAVPSPAHASEDEADGAPDDLDADEDDAWPGSVADAADAELLDAAARLGEPDDEDGDDTGIVLPRGAVAEVHGLEAYGDLPLVVVDGRTFGAVRPAADPRRLVRLSRPRPAAGRWRGTPSAARGTAASAARADAPVRGLVRRTPLPAVVVPALAALVAWAAAWVTAEPVGWLRLAGLAASAAAVAHGWVTTARPRLAGTGTGLRVAGAWRDESVPWAHVTAVVADDRALVVRLVDDALLLPAAGAPLLAGDPAPAEAARVLEARRAAAPAGPAAPVRRRVSPAVVAAVLWAGAVVGPQLLRQLGG
ncbi:hypothetical protein ACFUMH_10955 [Cellulomonas sp. NPDC057328]|uniref:hypothetical protein n=1 Tax=Cellulomonas sp. NPDC057328 TaxID=3346101 RepID=UPI0036370008